MHFIPPDDWVKLRLVEARPFPDVTLLTGSETRRCAAAAVCGAGRATLEQSDSEGTQRARPSIERPLAAKAA
jgi:hypothetical protein